MDDVCKALDQLEAPALGKRQVLDRLLTHARLAISRGVTLDAVVDCLTEHGIRMSPAQMRTYLSAGRAPGRPPESKAMTKATGAVSALAPPQRKRGRPRLDGDK